VGHLDQLKDDFAEEGLSVVAVTKQDRSAVQKFVDETGATHSIVIEEGDSMRAYGRSSYPSAFLINTNGRILWVGHPGNLKDDVIKEHLASAHILPEFPKALSSARKALDKDKFADAGKKVQKALDGTSLSDEERKTTETIRDWIDWYATSTLEGAAKDLEAGNVFEANRAYEEITKIYKGHAIGTRSAGLSKALLSDSANKTEVKAGKKLAKILVEMRELKPKKALKALAPLLSKKYADTKAGQKATEMAAELKKRIK
jgi:hypothetical protein